MFCTHCGKELPDDAVFCTNCGTKVTVTMEESRQDNIRTTPNTTSPIPQHIDNENNTNKKFLGIIILIMILIGGLFLYMYQLRGSESKITASTAQNTPPKQNVVVETAEVDGKHYELFNCGGIKCAVIDIGTTDIIGRVTTNEKFLLLMLYIRNETKQTYNYSYTRLKLLDKRGRFYAPSFSAISSLVLECKIQEAALMKNINPGLSTIVIVPFEVPKNLEDSNTIVINNSEIPEVDTENYSFPCKVMQSQSLQQNGDTSKTAKLPPVPQNPINSNGPTVPPQNGESNYSGTDFFPPGSMRDRITGTSVNMRSGPGLEHNIIGSFDKDEIVVEIDNQMSKKDSWVKVRRKNGDVGWVSGQYCELMKDPKIDYSKYINAVGVLYDYHEAVTKKDYKKAYNLLAPEQQKTSASPDQFSQGYLNVISSTVMETYPRSTDGNTVFVEYLLERKDKTPSGLSVKNYKAFADLHRINGEWKIGQTSVGRGNFDRKTLLE